MLIIGCFLFPIGYSLLAYMCNMFFRSDDTLIYTDEYQDAMAERERSAGLLSFCLERFGL